MIRRSRGFRNLPIGRKIIVIVMLTTGAALGIASVVLVLAEAITYRDAIRRDLAAVASIIADNSTAALTFGDPVAASETLGAVRVKANIRCACIYDEQGNLFVSYARQDQPARCPPRPVPATPGLIAGSLTVSQPVMLDQKRIGTIYVESNLEEFTTRLTLHILTLGGVLLLAGLAAFLISSRLQRLISWPVMSLAATAERVSRTKDFRIRAGKETEDEVGRHVDSFNNMLSEILARDTQMAVARTHAEESARRSAFLAEASRILGSSLDSLVTLSSVARLAVPIMGEVCVVDVADSDEIERRAAYAEGLSDPRLLEALKHLPNFDPPGATTIAIRTGKPLIDTPIQIDPAVHAVLRLKSYLALPLISGGRILGSLGFASTTPDRYSEEDVRLGEQLADRAAVALDNARLYRELQKSNRLKDEFLATMSHELRTPLTAIVGWTRLIKSGKLPVDKYQQAIDVIDRSAELETRLVDDILDASRIITGKLRLDFELLDMVDILESTIDLLRPAAEAKNISLDLESGHIPRVRGNAERLQQVFWNLVSNAVKFTPPGGSVKVSAAVVGSFVEVQVADTGIGIAQEFLPYVFERFRQADASSTRKHGGLGLGLAIVRHLVELHGGTVAADSPGAGQGATFTVRIPVSEPAERPRLRVVSRANPGEAADLQGVRALVVEDDRDTRELMIQALEQHGAVAYGADSYDSAVGMLEDFIPDVFLIDIGMPGRDGFALISRIRSMPKARRIPAIAVTAYAAEMDRKAVMEAGFQRHVAKPFEPDYLVHVVAATRAAVK